MPASRTALIGKILIYLIVALLVLDGLAQLLLPAFMVGIMEASQFPLSMAPALGTVTLLCAATLAVPRLAVLGAVLVTGFLGGAIATHLRLGEIASPPQLACLVIGLVMWLGLYLSDLRVRALLPVVIRPARL